MVPCLRIAGDGTSSGGSSPYSCWNRSAQTFGSATRDRRRLLHRAIMQSSRTAQRPSTLRQQSCSGGKGALLLLRIATRGRTSFFFPHRRQLDRWVQGVG